MNSEAFRKALSPYISKGIVFVGLGNPLRGDDGAGLIFVERLEASGWFQEAHHVLAGVTPENYLEPLLHEKPELVVFVDAAWFEGSPGEIRWMERLAWGPYRISTHAFSIGLVEDYLNSHLHRVAIRYLGIRPAWTGWGEGLSERVRSSLDRFFGMQTHERQCKKAKDIRWGG